MAKGEARPLTDDERALAEENVRLGWWAARWLYGRGVPREDAASDGGLALVLAVIAWIDKGRAKGHALSTYVRWQARARLSAWAKRGLSPRRIPDSRLVPLDAGEFDGDKAWSRDWLAVEDAGRAAVDLADEVADALARVGPGMRAAAEAVLSGLTPTRAQQNALWRARGLLARGGRPNAQRRWTAGMEAALREAVAEGLGDAEAALRLGVTRKAFEAKRMSLGLRKRRRVKCKAAG